MKLIGFNFKKISAEKIKNISGKIDVKANIDVLNIKEVNSDIFNKSKENLLGVDFIYFINYELGFAKIELKGDLLLSVDSKETKEILKNWEDKKMPDNFKVDLFNIILMKTTVKTLQLEEEIGLPAHVSLPKIESNKDNKDNKDL